MKAFPQSQFRGDEPIDTSEHGGMMLRDYFAAKAMQGILANPSHNDSDERIVKDAWKIANQMMEARNE